MRALDKSALYRAAMSLPESLITEISGPIGRVLRRIYWKQRLGAMGEGCVIEKGVMIQSPEHVYLGDQVWLDTHVQIIAGPPRLRGNMRTKANHGYRGKPGEVHLRGGNHIAPFCILQGHGGIWLGRDVGVAARTSIYTLSNHYRASADDDVFPAEYRNAIKFSPFAPEAESALVCGPVVFEDGSGLGLHSVVLPGSTVSRYSWIGTASVVNGDFVPEGVIAAGNPLRVVKQRFSGAKGH